MSREIEKAKQLRIGRTAGLFENRLSFAWRGLTAHHLSKRGTLFSWAVLFTVSATIIHFIAIVKQLPPSWLLAALLIVFTLVQAATVGAVVAVPARGLLLLAAMVEALGLLGWLIAHLFGITDGFTIWRAETLGVPDLYLPIIEGMSAGFFLSLAGRTWSATPRVWRIVFIALPYLLILGLLVGIVLKSVAIVVVFLVPGVITSIQYFFLPIFCLFAVLMILRLFVRSLRVKTPGAWSATGILLPAFLLLNLVTWGGGVSAIDTAWLASAAPIRVSAGQTATLAYCKSSNGGPLAMDISEPSAQAPRPAPMVLLVHGGETLVGSRIIDDGTLDGTYFAQLRADLLARGFIFGSIDYGLVPLSGVREQVADAKCAVRFLRTHAGELGLDPQRIGVGGPSQGGYISAMLGTVGPEVGYDVGQYLDQSSKVQAVVDMWGPADLSNFSGSPGWASLLVGRGTPAQLRGVSPMYHVAPGDPPFLIMHGSDDWFIAPHHSQDLAKRLQAAGVPVTLVMIQHDGHGLAAPTSGQVEQPNPGELIQMICNFFVRTLSSGRADT